MLDALEARLRRARELVQLLSDPTVLADRQRYQRYAKDPAAPATFLALGTRYEQLTRQRQEAERLSKEKAKILHEREQQLKAEIASMSNLSEAERDRLLEEHRRELSALDRQLDGERARQQCCCCVLHT